MKKAFVLFITMILVLSVFSGCSNSKTPESNNNSGLPTVLQDSYIGLWYSVVS